MEEREEGRKVVVREGEEGIRRVLEGGDWVREGVGEGEGRRVGSSLGWKGDGREVAVKNESESE